MEDTSLKPKLYTWLLTLSLSICIPGLAGCSSAKSTPSSPMTASSSTDVAAEYTIGVGDELAVSVWRNPDLSVTVPVRPDGRISVPLAGDLVAAGKTPVALAEGISDRLTNFLKGPQVTVIVANPASADFQRRVRVTGAVGSPLSLPFREGMTVLDLVLLAGGTNDFASPKNAKLYRKSGGSVFTYDVDLDKLLNKGNLGENYTLQPSDVLSVPERLF